MLAAEEDVWVAPVDGLAQLHLQGGDERLQAISGLRYVFRVAFELELDEAACALYVVEDDLDLG